MYLLQQEAFSEGPEKTYLQLTIVPSPDSAEARLSVEGCEATEPSREDWLRCFLFVCFVIFSS